MKVLSNNIDTLKIGFYARLKEGLVDELQELKDKADNDNNNKVKFSVAGFDFYVSPVGAHRYSYILNWKNGFKFKINPYNGAYSNIMVRVSSYACHNMEYYDILKMIIDELTEEVEKEKVSQIHYAVDVTDFTYNYDVHNNFAGAPRKDMVYRENREITGGVIGSMEKSSPLFLRIYNKTNEIMTKKKGYWLFDKYNDELDITTNEDGSINIWRFEFELKRKFIKQFKIETFQDVLDKSNDIWRYLTDFRVDKYGEKMSAWVSFKDRSVSEQAQRCPVLDFWQKISQVKWFTEDYVYQTRIRDRKINREQIEKQALGCLTTVAASMNLNISDLFIYMKKLYRENRSMLKDSILEKNVAFQL